MVALLIGCFCPLGLSARPRPYSEWVKCTETRKVAHVEKSPFLWMLVGVINGMKDIIPQKEHDWEKNNWVYLSIYYADGGKSISEADMRNMFNGRPVSKNIEIRMSFFIVPLMMDIL